MISQNNYLEYFRKNFNPLLCAAFSLSIRHYGLPSVAIKFFQSFCEEMLHFDGGVGSQWFQLEFVQQTEMFQLLLNYLISEYFQEILLLIID